MYFFLNDVVQLLSFFRALQKGFHEVIPQHHLRPFDERELELVIGKYLI